MVQFEAIIVVHSKAIIVVFSVSPLTLYGRCTGANLLRLLSKLSMREGGLFVCMGNPLCADEFLWMALIIICFHVCTFSLYVVCMRVTVGVCIFFKIL